MTMNEWYERYKELLDFRNRNGHIDVPVQPSSNGDYSDGLGEWVSEQRSLFCKQSATCSENGIDEKGVNGSFSKEKTILMEALSMDCGPSTQNDESQTGRDDLIRKPQEIPSSHFIDSSSNQENVSMASTSDHQEAAPRPDMMDVADAYTIRAVLHSHERKRAHNELMHKSLKALFAEKIRTGSLFDNTAFNEESNDHDDIGSNSK